MGPIPVSPASPPAVIRARPLYSLQEFQQCVDLQRQVWGFDESDLVPSRMFVVVRKVGGQVFGAYDGDRFCGYALALPGDRGGRLYLHSHMLAVAPEYRNSGVGRMLKLEQRRDAISRGIELMEWTFDPLEIKNAYFNLERLGAIVRRYVPNQYGITSSRLQGGLPTDRLVAEWWMQSRRVETVLERNRRPEFEVLERVAIPGEIYRWKDEGDERARELQTQVRERLQACFRAGLAVLGYERGRAAGGQAASAARSDDAASGTYLLGRWDENWNYGGAVDERAAANGSKAGHGAEDE
jgi:predicted GNAT superfamily acetyltransferase